MINILKKITQEVETKEDDEKIIAWQTKFGKKLDVSIIHYKKTKLEKYDFDLTGVKSDDLYFDTILKVEKGPEYLYESGEFKVKRYISGASASGPSYYFSYAFPDNKGLIQKNKKAIKAIEDLVGKDLFKNE